MRVTAGSAVAMIGDAWRVLGVVCKKGLSLSLGGFLIPLGFE